MKAWFKHYNNAHGSKTIQRLQKKFGFHLGYAYYFILLEYCHAQWDGNSKPFFVINEQTLRYVLHISSKGLQKVLDTLSKSKNFEVKQNEKVLEISWPKLLEIQDKDAKYNRKRIASESHGAILEKNKKKKKKKKKIKEQKDYSVFLEKIYSIYPRKEGKTKGLSIISKQIKTEKNVDNFQRAVINYTEHCRAENIEKQFIKHFSTFCNKEFWVDWINYKGTNERKTISF